MKEKAVQNNTGTCLVLTGKCAGGKTTFARRIYAQLVREGIPAVYVPQQNEYLLEDETVLANIILKPGDDEKAGELADRFGIGGLLERRAGELSGGEKRLTAMLRGLYTAGDDGVLFLDEPTNDLDREQTLRLYRVLAERRAGPTVIITHDDRLSGLADEIFVFPDDCGREAQITELIRSSCGRRAYGGKKPSDFFTDRLPDRRFFVLFYSLMALAAVLVFAFYAGSPESSVTPLPAEREIDLILPDSDYGGAALTDGAIPMSAFGIFDPEMSMGEKAKILMEASENAFPGKVNHDALTDLPGDYRRWPLEYIVPEDRTYINVIERYNESLSDDMRAGFSDVFTAEEDGGADVAGDPALLADMAEQIGREMPEARISYLAVLYPDDESFMDAVNSGMFRELAGAGVYVKSRETAELCSLIRKRTRIIQTTTGIGAALGLLGVIFLASYAIILGGRKRLILIQRDTGIDRKYITESVRRRHGMGAVRAGTLAAAAAACWLLSRAGGGFTPDELLLMLIPAGAASEITASLMSLADRIIISGITKGDL